MTKQELETHAMCTRAFMISDVLAAEYAEKNIVDDFDTFRFLMYMLEIKELRIDELEERINELEQKQKAHNNA